MLPDCSDPKSECPDIQIRLPRHKWPKSWANIEDFVVLLERNPYGHPSAGLVWERRFEEVLLELGWEKVQNWECLFVRRKQGLFLSVYVDDTKNGWKVAECGSHVEEIDEKTLILTNQHHFLVTYILGCIQRECNPNETIIDECRQMFESRISALATEKLPGFGRASRKEGCIVLRHGRTCSKMC